MKDWSSLVVAGTAFFGWAIGAWKFLYNHIEHVKSELREDLKEIKADVKAIRDKLNA